MACWVGGDHKECVDDDVEVEGRERVARVVIVPHADLHGRDDGGVEEEEVAADHHACECGRQWILFSILRVLDRFSEIFTLHEYRGGMYEPATTNLAWLGIIITHYEGIKNTLRREKEAPAAFFAHTLIC